MYTLKDIMDRNIVLHIPTKQIFKKILEALEKRGILWPTGQVPSRGVVHWDDYKAQTYLRLSNQTITYGTLDNMPFTKTIVILPQELFLKGGQPPKEA